MRLLKLTTSAFMFSMLFQACDGSGSKWTSSDEEELVENCLETVAVNLPEKTAEIYCDCQLDFFKKQYKNPDELRKDMRNKQRELGRAVQDECLDYAKEEAKKKKNEQ